MIDLIFCDFESVWDDMANFFIVKKSILYDCRPTTWTGMKIKLGVHCRLIEFFFTMYLM